MSLNKLRYLLSIIVLSNISFTLFGMGRQIKGRLLTYENQPVIAGAIKIFSPDSTFISGTLSDTLGLFSLPFETGSDAFILAECLGYRSVKRSITINEDSICIGDIRLSPANNRLDEVTVMADRVVKTNNGFTIHPRKNDLKFASSGYDVLYNMMIPGINVNRLDGSISRMGEPVAIYINGNAASYKEIQNIPVRLIERVEYIDIPYGIYINDTSAINIITKKEYRGTYLSVLGKRNLSYNSGEYSAMVQHTNDKVTIQIYGGHENHDYDNGHGSKTETYNINGTTVHLNKTIEEDMVRLNRQYIQAHIMSSSKKRFLSANMSLIREKEPDNTLIERINGSGQNYSNISSENMRPTLKLTGEFNFPAKQRLRINMTNTFVDNKYDRIYMSDGFESVSKVKETLFNSSVNLNYSKQCKSGTISIAFIDSYRNSGADYIGHSDKSQDLSTNEAILQAAFTKNSNKHFLLNSRIGVSWLKYKLKDESDVNQFSPRVNVILRYSPTKTNALSFNFNSGNSFPLINTLNDVSQTVNEHMVKKGNPNLKISRIFNTALMYNYFSKKLNIQAMAINNIFTHMTLPLYIEYGDNVLHTFDSNTKLIQNLAVLSGSYAISKSLNIKSEIAFIQSSFTGRFEKSHRTFRTSIDANYVLKNILLNISLKLPEKVLSNNGITNRDFIHYNANISWALSNWYIELGTVNLFYKRSFYNQSYNSPVYSYEIDDYNRTQQSNIYVKVNFKFSSGKKQKIQKMELEKTFDSSIMKL